MFKLPRGLGPIEMLRARAVIESGIAALAATERKDSAPPFVCVVELRLLKVATDSHAEFLYGRMAPLSDDRSAACSAQTLNADRRSLREFFEQAAERAHLNPLERQRQCAIIDIVARVPTIRHDLPRPEAVHASDSGHRQQQVQSGQ